MSHMDVVIQCNFTGSIHQTAATPVFNFGGWGWTQNHAARSGNETASLPVLILAVTEMTKCVLLICICSVVFLRCAGILLLANNKILTTAKTQRLCALVLSMMNK